MRRTKFTGILSFMLVLVMMFSSVGMTFYANAESDGDALPVSVTQSFSVDPEKPMTVSVNGEETILYSAKMTACITGSAKVNVADARMTLRVAAGLEKYDGDVSLVDINRNGKADIADARYILRYAANLDMYYLAADGSVVSGFVTNADGKTMLMSEVGSVTTGLVKNDGELYYFDRSGIMATGLVKITGEVYYFAEDGKGFSGETEIDGDKYCFNNGKAVTGFVKNGEDFSYYNESGVMVTGLTVIDGSTYYFDENGKSYNGDITVDGNDYRFKDGKAVVGLVKNGDHYNYFFNDGKMAKNYTLSQGGYKYVFDAEGKAVPKKISYKVAMIGDSIVATIAMNGVTNKIDLYGKVSLTSTGIFDKKIQGSSRAVIDEVSGRGYNRVIILLGINELYTGNDTWAANYKKVIAGVRQRCGNDVEVYLHSILPVNEQRARANGYDRIVTNANIQSKNARLKELAKSEGCTYLDYYSVIVSNGQLPYDAASDGIHIGKTYCQNWAAWLENKVCQ